MNHNVIAAHYKPLLDQINELENSRRLQECKLVEERTRNAKTLKELEDCKFELTTKLVFIVLLMLVNLKQQRLVSNEALLKEKITHLEMELRNDMKASEQLKTSVKYCKQEEEVFEKHVLTFSKNAELKM
jgi:hypothetical protein